MTHTILYPIEQDATPDRGITPEEAIRNAEDVKITPKEAAAYQEGYSTAMKRAKAADRFYREARDITPEQAIRELREAGLVDTIAVQQIVRSKKPRDLSYDYIISAWEMDRFEPLTGYTLREATDKALEALK